MALLRPLQPDDLPQLIEVYREAVLELAPPLYSSLQVEAWAAHSAGGALRTELSAGFGLASCSQGGATIEAFALLHPIDRLSLLYCRGRSSRQGRASALLEAVENHGRQRGVMRLRTEASQLSRPLLERRGWRVERPERVLFAGVAFDRFRMAKLLLDPGLSTP